MGILKRAVTPAPEANTVDDQKWRGIQERARRANPEANRFGTKEHDRRARQGQENYNQARRGNN